MNIDWVTNIHGVWIRRPVETCIVCSIPSIRELPGNFMATSRPSSPCHPDCASPPQELLPTALSSLLFFSPSCVSPKSGCWICGQSTEGYNSTRQLRALLDTPASSTAQAGSRTKVSYWLRRKGYTAFTLWLKQHQYLDTKNRYAFSSHASRRTAIDGLCFIDRLPPEVSNCVCSYLLGSPDKANGRLLFELWNNVARLSLLL